MNSRNGPGQVSGSLASTMGSPARTGIEVIAAQCRLRTATRSARMGSDRAPGMRLPVPVSAFATPARYQRPGRATPRAPVICRDIARPPLAPLHWTGQDPLEPVRRDRSQALWVARAFDNFQPRFPSSIPAQTSSTARRCGRPSTGSTSCVALRFAGPRTGPPAQMRQEACSIQQPLVHHGNRDRIHDQRHLEAGRSGGPRSLDRTHREGRCGDARLTLVQASDPSNA
jgi:hypothetical protein